MDKNNIKSKDLCERCEYSSVNSCGGRQCGDCEMDDGENCKCHMIQYGTPCEYFRDVEERTGEKVYIAGKISGDPGYRQKFGRAAAMLTEKGCAVLNPAVLPDGITGGEAMRICLAMIDAADIVVLLPDWKESKGAQLEYQYCCYAGKPAVRIEEFANSMKEGGREDV